MKKSFKKCLSLFMVITVMLVSSLSVFANPIQEIEGKSSTTKSVYDSRGNFLGEIESFDELDKYSGKSAEEERGWKELLIKFLWDVGVGMVVEELNSQISNAFDYLNKYSIHVPAFELDESAYVYSLDGNVYNPYPPNSYQGATWQNTNFLVVIE